LRIGETTLGIALDETTTPETVEAVWHVFGGKWPTPRSRPARAKRCRRTCGASAPSSLIPSSTPPLGDRAAALHAQLSDRDLALDRAMIPLGSCTMKLNATTEMIR